MRAILIAAALVVTVIGSLAACELGCATALAEGVLVADGQNLVLQAPTGERNTIVWPSGYGVRQDGDGLVLTDRFGTIKAREGDKIGVGGGVGTDDVFHGCGDVWIETPTPGA
jgi:hypothetical protein